MARHELIWGNSNYLDGPAAAEGAEVCIVPTHLLRELHGDSRRLMGPHWLEREPLPWLASGWEFGRWADPAVAEVAGPDPEAWGRPVSAEFLARLALRMFHAGLYEAARHGLSPRFALDGRDWVPVWRDESGEDRIAALLEGYRRACSLTETQIATPPIGYGWERVPFAEFQPNGNGVTLMDGYDGV